MYALSGYVKGNTINTGEDLYVYEGHRVIITILDDTMGMMDQPSEKAVTSRRTAAARTIAGMWSTHDDGAGVDEMIRSMRRSRCFGC